jgi:hypothetical protein
VKGIDERECRVRAAGVFNKKPVSLCHTNKVTSLIVACEGFRPDKTKQKNEK